MQVIIEGKNKGRWVPVYVTDELNAASRTRFCAMYENPGATLRYRDMSGELVRVRYNTTTEVLESSYYK